MDEEKKFKMNGREEQKKGDKCERRRLKEVKMNGRDDEVKRGDVETLAPPRRLARSSFRACSRGI